MMKINNGLIGNLLGKQASTIELNKNEVYRANIKTRFSNNEAMVQIKGRDFRVRFEGNTPKENRTSIKITNVKDDIFTVKNINVDNNQAKMDNDISKLIVKCGIKPTPELKQAAKTLVDNGGTITKETLKNLENFISKGKGTISEKLDTIENMAKKGIEITPSNIEAAHEALHGEGLDDILSEISRSIDSETLDKITNNIENGSKTEERLLREALQQMRDILENNGDLDEISEIIKNKIGNKDIAAQLEKALQTLKALKNVGYEKAGINKLSQILDQIEGQISNNDLALSGTAIKDINNNIQQSLEQALSGVEPSTKAFVMTKITKEMSMASDKFTDLKRSVIRNMDTITKITSGAKINVSSHVKGMIENSIDILDKAILKSEITLFTDMKTERDLLGLSSKLAEARKLLSKGQNSQATKILNEVKSKFMKLNWKPSQNKVIHGATKESMLLQNKSSQNSLATNIANTLNNHQNAQLTARSTFDLFRALGLNYESEIAQKLAGNLEQSSQQDLEKNLKAILLKHMEVEGKGLKDSSSNQSIVKALNNLTGQQLLSKQDNNSHQQNMYFNIPFKMGEDLKSVKLYVNGRKQNEKIDWENSSLYFLIDTDKMGPTGIKISSTDKNLTLTIKNNEKRLEKKVGELTGKLKDNLEKIGYNVVGLNFTELNNDDKKETKDEKVNKTLELTDRLNKKGFDLKI